MATVELDPQFVQSIKLLHSTNKDSADQLRVLIDEVIRQKYGASKMLSNVLHKRYMIEETILSEHTSSSSSSSSSKKKSSSSSSTKHSSKSSKSNSPVTIQTHDSAGDILPSDDTLALDDLTCVMCKGMDVSARNQLVECTECHSLYHQECHVPHISDSQIDVPRSVWYCSKCSKEPQVSKERSSPKPASESKSKDSKKSSTKKLSKSQKSSSKKNK